MVFLVIRDNPMMGTGKEARSTATVSTLSKMEAVLRDSIKMTKSTAEESTIQTTAR